MSGMMFVLQIVTAKNKIDDSTQSIDCYGALFAENIFKFILKNIKLHIVN